MWLPENRISIAQHWFRTMADSLLKWNYMKKAENNYLFRIVMVPVSSDNTTCQSSEARWRDHAENILIGTIIYLSKKVSKRGLDYTEQYEGCWLWWRLFPAASVKFLLEFCGSKHGTVANLRTSPASEVLTTHFKTPLHALCFQDSWVPRLPLLSFDLPIQLWITNLVSALALNKEYSPCTSLKSPDTAGQDL